MNNRLLILIFVSLLLGSCGYHHPASHPVGSGTISIHAGTWENRTNEIALEGLLLQKTADWLQQSGTFRLESDPARADFLLSGTIEAVNNPATAFNSGDRATTLKAWAKVTYRLVDRTTGIILWEINDTVRDRNYQAGDDAVRNRSNKEEALAVIAEELAEQIYLKVISTLNEQPRQPAN